MADTTKLSFEIDANWHRSCKKLLLGLYKLC